MAQKLDAVLLINERPAARYAISLGIDVLAVPSLIVALWSRGIISHRAAHRKLDLIEANTAPEIVTEARLALGPLAPPDPPKADEP